MNVASKIVALAILAIPTGSEAFALYPNPDVEYPPQSFVVLNHLGGDRDFYGGRHGGGPYFTINVELQIVGNEVWARVTATAQEVGGDTVAYDQRFLLVARFARPICRIVSVTTGGHAYYDRTVDDLDTFYNPCANGLLHSVQYVGDTRGDESGFRTGYLLHFNPVLAE